jgi:hypothetical protein
VKARYAKHNIIASKKKQQPTKKEKHIHSKHAPTHYTPETTTGNHLAQRVYKNWRLLVYKLAGLIRVELGLILLKTGLIGVYPLQYERVLICTCNIIFFDYPV